MVSQIESSTAAGTAEPTKEARQASDYGRPACLHCLGMQAPVTARYFGPFNPHRRNKWVYGDRETGAYLHQYAWTTIVRHVPVTGRHSPDDPALAQYWADRRRKRKPPQLAESWQRALREQHGLCPLCQEPLLYTDRIPDSPSQWESWYAAIRKAMTHQAITERGSGRTKHRLVHAHCARRHPDPGPQSTDQKTADACPPKRAA